jgi:hypothetical protein
MFLRDKTGKPVGCIAMSVNLDRDKYSFRYNYSVLNPVDEFKRDLARQIALGRLLEAPIKVKCELPLTGRDDVSYEVMVDIANNSNVPARARRAARAWLKGILA